MHRNNLADKEISEGASLKASDEVCNGSGSCERCCDGRLLDTYSLPIFIDFVLLFQMTQAAGGIVVHC
jgi:hypothetical protein